MSWMSQFIYSYLMLSQLMTDVSDKYYVLSFLMLVLLDLLCCLLTRDWQTEALYMIGMERHLDQQQTTLDLSKEEYIRENFINFTTMSNLILLKS